MRLLSRRSAMLALALGVPAAMPAGRRDVTDVVVSAGWLSQHASDRGVVILQVSRRAEYDKEHIVGARLIDPGSTENLEPTQAPGAAMDMNAMPTAAELRTRLEKLGISDGSHVVVAFGAPGVVMATRTIFLLRFAGVTDVSLLDGGLAAWKRAGYPVTAAAPVVTPGHFSGKLDAGLAVDDAFVLAHLHAPHFRIVDAREPVYYTATSSSQGMAAGHIPGAVNIPFNSLFDANHLLRPARELQAVFRDAGVQPGDTVIAYCHVGLQATSVVLSARAAGIPARMYVGSFHDWSARKHPTETSGR